MGEELLLKVAEEAWRGEAGVAVVCNVEPEQEREVLKPARELGRGKVEVTLWGRKIAELPVEFREVAWVEEKRYGRIRFCSGKMEEWFLPRPLDASMVLFNSPSIAAAYAHSSAAGLFLELYVRALAKASVLDELGRRLTKEEALAALDSILRSPEPLFGPPVKIPLEGAWLTADRWWLAAKRLDGEEAGPELLLDLLTLAAYIACLFASKERVTPIACKKALARTLLSREDRAFRGERPPPLKRKPLALLHLLELAGEEGVKLPRAIRACYGFDREWDRMLSLRDCDRFTLEHTDLAERICSRIHIKYRFPHRDYVSTLLLTPEGAQFGMERRDAELEESLLKLLKWRGLL